MSKASSRSRTNASRTSTNLSSPPSLSQTSVVSQESVPVIRNSEAEVPPTPQEVARKPWKYIGYKGYSEFLASEDDFLIFRKFATLNSRIALALQDRISVLERELADIDERYSRKDADDVNNGSFRDDQQDREELLDKIHDELVKYNKFMIQQCQMKAFPKAYRRDIKSLQAWHHNHGGRAINVDEQNYLNHEQDLFPVVPKEKTPLRRFLDQSRAFRTLLLWRKEDPNLQNYDQDAVLTMSDKRIDRFLKFLIIGIGAIMLIAPIWILEVISVPRQKLVVITIFIVLFLAMVSWLTVAKPFETLGATAAYSAVLMVFLQLDNTGSSH